jgi:hypothetical protein
MSHITSNHTTLQPEDDSDGQDEGQIDEDHESEGGGTEKLDPAKLDAEGGPDDDSMGESDDKEEEESSSGRVEPNAELFRQSHLGIQTGPLRQAAGSQGGGGGDGSRAREARGFGGIAGLAGVDLGYREGMPLGQLAGSKSVGEQAG